jgi:hypothetical protein
MPYWSTTSCTYRPHPLPPIHNLSCMYDMRPWLAPSLPPALAFRLLREGKHAYIHRLHMLEAHKEHADLVRDQFTDVKEYCASAHSPARDR